METQTQTKQLSTAEKVYNTIKRGAKKYYIKNAEKIKTNTKNRLRRIQEEDPTLYDEIMERNRLWKKNNKDKANQKNRESYKRRQEKKKAEKLLAKQEQEQLQDTDSETNSD